MKCLELVTGPDSNGVATGMPVAVIIARMKQRTEEDAESARCTTTAACTCARASNAYGGPASGSFVQDRDHDDHADHGRLALPACGGRAGARFDHFRRQHNKDDGWFMTFVSYAKHMDRAPISGGDPL